MGSNADAQAGVIKKIMGIVTDICGVSPANRTFAGKLAKVISYRAMILAGINHDTAIAQFRFTHGSDALSFLADSASLDGCVFVIEKARAVSVMANHGYLSAIIDQQAVDALLGISAKVNGADPGMVKKKNRQRLVVQARYMVWEYLNNTPFRVSLVRIGNMTGGRDHTTVLNGIKRHGEFIEFDKQYAHLWASFSNKANEYLGIVK